MNDFNTFFARISVADRDSKDATTITLRVQHEASAFLPLLSECELRDYLFHLKNENDRASTKCIYVISAEILND